MSRVALKSLMCVTIVRDHISMLCGVCIRRACMCLRRACVCIGVCVCTESHVCRRSILVNLGLY